MKENGLASEQQGYVTVAETLAYLMYGRAEALGRLPPGMPDMEEKWGYSTSCWQDSKPPFLRRLQHVLARVQWRLSREVRRQEAYAAPSPRLAADERAKLRELLRRSGSTAAELLNQMHYDIQEARRISEETTRDFDEAQRLLLDALKSGRVSATGRRGNALKYILLSITHERIDPIFFLNNNRRIDPDGWFYLIESGDDDEDDLLLEAAELGGGDYGDIRIPFAALEKAFAPGAARIARLEAGTKRGPGRPSAKNIYLEEFERRAGAGHLAPTLASEARCLLERAREAHPQVQHLQAKSIGAMIRRQYNHFVRRAKKGISLDNL